MAATKASADVPTLSDACLHSLIENPADSRKLYELSVDELVALNSRLLTEHQTIKKELNHLKENRYVVDPPVVQDRVDEKMRDLVSKTTSAWEPASSEDVIHHDMKAVTNMLGEKLQLSWDSTTGKVSYQSGRYRQQQSYGNIFAYQTIISSPLLLYRLCCLFQCKVDVEGPDGYKLVWSVFLKHKASGVFVGFSEWKGSALYRASKFPPTPTSFDEDWLALLNLLLDPCCPHPYDGTVAGSVA